jgi:hypothetical protein
MLSTQHLRQVVREAGGGWSASSSKEESHMSGMPGIVRRGIDRRFYTWAAVGTCIVVFAGFAKTYYLKGLFGTPELPALRHVHGLVMTLWFGLFMIQARLVAVRLVDLHRRLGLFGALLAALVLVVGIVTAIDAAKRGSSPGPPPLAFLAVPLGDMLGFRHAGGDGTLLAASHRHPSTLNAVVERLHAECGVRPHPTQLPQDRWSTPLFWAH